MTLLHCDCHPGATELAQLFKNLGTPLTIEKVAEVFMKYGEQQGCGQQGCVRVWVWVWHNSGGGEPCSCLV
jgi:hypothetical protein